MVRLIAKKKFNDIETNSKRVVGDIFNVKLERALKLLKMGLVDIISIDKLSKKKNVKKTIPSKKSR